MNAPVKLRNKSELTGVTDLLNPYVRYDSGPRIHMAAAQSQQMLIPFKPDAPISLTGFEVQMKKTTMAITMPCNATVIDIISKFTPSNTRGGIKSNSLKTIIYFNEDTGQYGSLDIVNYFRAHDIFAGELFLTQAGKYLYPNQSIPKGTVLAQTRAADVDGVYSSSLTANVANMGLAGVIEDGLIVSEEFLERAAPTAMAKRSAGWGKDSYPLPIYGDVDNYQCFPGPGEKLRADNLVFATRKYDPLLDMVNMLPEMLTRVNRAHDECVYAPLECEDATVVDVNVVTTSTGNRLRQTPPTMEEHTNNFVNQISAYYDRIVNQHSSLRQREGQNMRLEYAFEETVTYAMADRPNDPGRRLGRGGPTGSVQKTYKANPLDEWYVELEFSWRFKLREGAKLTDFHGCKGVVCEIRPAADMPYDEFGNRADVVQFSGSVIARMNTGQEMERYINAACRDVSKDVRAMVANNPADWRKAWEHAMGFIKICSPKQYNFYMQRKDTDLKKKEYVDTICNDILRLYMAPDAPEGGASLIKAIRQYRRPDKGFVTYRNYDGNWVTTKTPILIAPKQMIVLDKSSFKPMAVSVGQRQNHGLLATTNKRTKVAHPVNRNPPRSWGESEIRNMAANMGGEETAYIVDFSVNPEALKDGLIASYNIEKPFMHYQHIDRKKHPAGGGRTIQFVKNILGGLGTVMKTVVNKFGK